LSRLERLQILEQFLAEIRLILHGSVEPVEKDHRRSHWLLASAGNSVGDYPWGKGRGLYVRSARSDREGRDALGLAVIQNSKIVFRQAGNSAVFRTDHHIYLHQPGVDAKRGWLLSGHQTGESEPPNPPRHVWLLRTDRNTNRPGRSAQLVLHHHAELHRLWGSRNRIVDHQTGGQGLLE